MYADVKQPPEPPPWCALVSTSVPFVCTSDDVSSQAPPRVVVGPSFCRCFRKATYYLHLYLPTSVSIASEREIEERVVVVVAGALARNRWIVYLYLSLPTGVEWREDASLVLGGGLPSLPSSLAFFSRLSPRIPLSPPVLLHHHRRHGIAGNLRVPIDTRYRTYRTPTIRFCRNSCTSFAFNGRIAGRTDDSL